jgi:integrase
VGKPQGLVKRGNVYFYRVRVPNDIAPRVGKRELKTSLRTSDFALAKVRRNEAAARFDRQFAELRASRTGSVCSPRSASLYFDEAASRVRAHVEDVSRRYREEMAAADRTDRETAAVISDCAVEAGQLTLFYQDPSNPVTLQDIALTLSALLGNSQPSLTLREKEQLFEITRRGLLEIERRALATIKNSSHASFDPEFAPTAVRRALTLDDLTVEYLKDYERSNDTGVKRQNSVKASLEVIKEFFGSQMPVAHIERRQCREFRDLLNELPSNWRKHFPNMSHSLKEICERGKAKGLPNMKHDTQDTYFCVLKMVLDWAREEGHIESNPADGLHALGDQKPAKERRDPIGITQLQQIFNAPLYTGCVDDQYGYAKPGNQKPRGTRFWIPLIGQYSGMRLNEICQLEVSDIRCSPAGTWYFSVNPDGDKRVKNPHSKREAPIHPELVKLGLLDFVQAQGSSGKLFKDLKISKHGYYSEWFTRWFNGAFLTQLGIKTNMIGFHSFRHGFKDALRRVEAPTAIDDAICGWSSLKGSSKNYGKGYNVDQLAEWVAKIRFEGLDLSHLYPTTAD